VHGFDSRQGKTSTRNAPGAVDKENSSKVVSAKVTKGSFSVSRTVYPCEIFKTVAAAVLEVENVSAGLCKEISGQRTV
jgi:hypothetical protein